MGRAYNKEVAKLADTYEWCPRTDVSNLASFIRSASHVPMSFVGSGGSYAAAAFAAWLHELYAERMARPATVLDIASSPAARNSAVLFITASGKHPDILGAFRRVALMEPTHLGVLCGADSSPMADAVRGFSGTCYMPFPFPAGKDGFLATNSVLTSVTLLLKAFWVAYSLAEKLPPFKALEPRGTDILLRAGQVGTAKLWEYPNILVLYGPTGSPAAMDFESRFHEAGLAAVQLADFRNFAHGRHYWLARMKPKTAVLALVTPNDAGLAERTMKLLPSEVQRSQISVHSVGPLASIELFLFSIHMASWAGHARGIDPGNPTVPEFGRRIYHLDAWAGVNDERRRVDTPIWRKSGLSRAVLQSTADRENWESAHSEFVNDLASSGFCGVVVDYDDTVCAPAERLSRPGPKMAAELNRLLGGGLWLGVATGRGKSVRKALRSVIKRRFWARVLVAYYNGAEVAALSDSSKPNVSKREIKGVLREFLRLLDSEDQLAAVIEKEANAAQVKIEPAGQVGLPEVARWIQHIIATARLPLRAVVSSKSIDIIPMETSKNAVVSAIRRACGPSAEVLCIGDSGEWPGNDFELLSNPHSLSSDSTSPDPATCWNLAPVGVRCVDATLTYLKSLELADGYAHFRLGALAKP